jgi:cytochrome c biogenesis protein CcdA/thiol-disulfide isomerase/thioredoxin
MIVLLGIGFVAGLITAVSPCVLPVLPIILAGSAGGGKRRPYAIIGGLVASFSAFLLVGSWLLDQLGLPQDFLRDAGLAVLFLLAATLIVPHLGGLLERPLARLTRRRHGELGGGFLLGVSLGVVFVPCAGPVLTAVTVISAAHHIGAESFLLTLFYALGAGSVMLAIALGAQRASGRLQAFRAHAGKVRVALGVAIAATALAIVFNYDRGFQTALPGYTDALQKHVESSAYAKKQLARLSGAGEGVARAATTAQLGDYGSAPDFRGISLWLNTPGNRPLTMAKLRGKVVLVDFWTYSCINCLRTLPHLEAWYRTYKSQGFEIVGVHTPEFAFEHVPSNVRTAVRKLGVRYPVPLDNDYATWNAYSNQYWPAEYLIDKRGHVRHAHFGEGEYGKTERLIRALLHEPTNSLPVASRLADPTPTELTTPETYLGYQRLARYAGSRIVRDVEASYRLPHALAQDELAYGGAWRVAGQRIIAGPGARLRLHFHARNVYLVAGGRGQVTVFVDGRSRGLMPISGISRLYTVLRYPAVRDGILELRFTPGMSSYAFTFG